MILGDELTTLYDQKQELELEKKKHVGFLQNFNNSLDEEHVYKHYNMWDKENNVLNGIAYRQVDDTFVLTGKMWNHIHQVKLDYHQYVTEKPINFEEQNKADKDTHTTDDQDEGATGKDEL